MKIWVDTASTTRSSVQAGPGGLGDCSDDCSSECDDCYRAGGNAGSVNVNPTEEESAYYLSRLLQRAELYQQRSDDGDRVVVCNPSSAGHVAVLDAEAYKLLEQFQRPTRFLDGMGGNSRNFSSIGRNLALFASLGFLQDLEQPTFSFVNEVSQTLVAWLHVTNACNLGCHYCYIAKSAEAMEDDTARRAVDAVIRSARNNHFRHVKLKYAGGEASLQTANVLATHDYAVQQAEAQDLELSGSILSNGLVLPQRTIEQFKVRRIGVMISLDGIGEEHDRQRPLLNGKGSFQYVDRTITNLLRNGLVPHINVTVSQRNLSGLPELIEYILDREMPFTLSYYRDNECSTHLKDLQFQDGQMIAGMRAAFRVIEERLPRRRLIGSLIDKANMTMAHQQTCGVGRNYLVIDQRGGVAKCQADIGHTVTTIAADDPLRVINMDHNGLQGLPVESKAGCRDCEWRYWCTGGCPLLTYRVTGRNDVKSPNCHIYQALFPDAIRLEALRLLKYEAPLVLEDERVLCTPV